MGEPVATKSQENTTKLEQGTTFVGYTVFWGMRNTFSVKPLNHQVVFNENKNAETRQINCKMRICVLRSNRQ